jgi:hypothetical protein
MSQLGSATLGTLQGPIAAVDAETRPSTGSGTRPTLGGGLRGSTQPTAALPVAGTTPTGCGRTLYCGSSALAYDLEVWAFARPSSQLVAELNDIVVDRHLR